VFRFGFSFTKLRKSENLACLATRSQCRLRAR
jgi:hypothetical protein